MNTETENNLLTQHNRDSDGYLDDPSQWDKNLAQALAAEQSITLRSEHWPILHAAREYYLEHELHLTNRALIKLLKVQQIAPSVDSIILHQLFGEFPASKVALIAGLPKPPFCFK